MIKTIIVEDEYNVREALKKMLKIIEPNIQIIAETGYVHEAIEIVKQQRPELLFLDIQLEDGTGFDILNQLDKHKSKIIFTTAYNEYAIKAFKFSAIDYLLKPIDPIDLKDAVKRAIESIKNDYEHQELLEVLKNNIAKKEQKIVLKTTEQRYIINVVDIIHLEADGAYTLFVTTTNKIIVSKNLKYYQDILNENDFIRCHQSHLVNKNHIIGISNEDKLIMSNSDLISISTRKKSEIIKLIASL